MKNFKDQFVNSSSYEKQNLAPLLAKVFCLVGEPVKFVAGGVLIGFVNYHLEKCEYSSPMPSMCR